MSDYDLIIAVERGDLTLSEAARIIIEADAEAYDEAMTKGEGA